MMSAFMFPYIWQQTKFKSRDREEIDTEEGTTEDRGTWYQERPAVGPNRPERGKN